MSMEWLSDLTRDLNWGNMLWTAVDIGVVYYIIYRGLLLIRGTRAVQMLLGMTLLFLLYFVSRDEWADLLTLNWLLGQVIGWLLVIVVVIFQKDIRRALVEVGKNPILTGGTRGEAIQFYEEVVRAADNLAKKQLGALIVFERETDLTEYTAQGVALDAEVTKELIFCIFIPQYQNPLHDGALIIQKGRATAAACYLPLSDDPRLERSLGTRHRAAVGIAEETDAVVIVVSEETGTVSLATGGHLVRGLDSNALRAELQKHFSQVQRARGLLQRLGFRRGRSRRENTASVESASERGTRAVHTTMEMQAVSEPQPPREEEP